MLGFDRGGAYPQVFTHCREQDVHWVTYRRAPLAVPAMLPVITVATIGGRQRTIAWAEEKVQLKDYGEARQLTLFEHGRVVLQILTSDFDACPADILAWLKSRWREENFLKYASENYGIDKICDYAAAIEVNTKITANPARKTANTRGPPRGKRARRRRARPRRAAQPTRTPPPPPRTPRSPPPSARSAPRAGTCGTAAAARDSIPAKLPADQIDPDARTAVLRTGRRGLQMVLRLLAHNAEHWLANHLNAYLRDNDEYRAATRADHHPRPRRNHHLHPRRDHRHPPGPRRTPPRPGPRPAHRRDQRPATGHPRRHPAHHLPHPPATADLIRRPAAPSGDLGPRHGRWASHGRYRCDDRDLVLGEGPGRADMEENVCFLPTSLIMARRARASRWPSCCARETPDRTPPPSTSTPPGWPSLSSRRARGGVCWSSADSGGGIHGFPTWLTRPGAAWPTPSGFTITGEIAEAILAYPLSCGPPPTTLTGRPAPGARVAEITGMLDLSTWPKACGSSSARNAPTPARSCGSPTSAATASPASPPAPKAASSPTWSYATCAEPGARTGSAAPRTPAAQPAPARLRPEHDLVRDRRAGLRTARLDPDARPARPRPPLGTQEAAAADLLRRRAHRPRRSAPPALHRRPLALGQPDHRRHHPARTP